SGNAFFSRVTIVLDAAPLRPVIGKGGSCSRDDKRGNEEQSLHGRVPLAEVGGGDGMRLTKYAQLRHDGVGSDCVFANVGSRITSSLNSLSVPATGGNSVNGASPLKQKPVGKGKLEED